MAIESGGNDRESWELAGQAARRVHNLSVAVLEAFSHGLDPAGLDPWDPEYHALAATVYPMTLSADYLAAVAEAFVGVAHMMDLMDPPTGGGADWVLLHDYLLNAGTTMGAPDVPDAAPEGIVAQVTPAVMRIDLLAAASSADGWRRMARACLGVVGSVHTMLGPSEVPDLADRLEAIETTLAAVSAVTRSHRQP